MKTITEKLALTITRRIEVLPSTIFYFWGTHILMVLLSNMSALGETLANQAPKFNASNLFQTTNVWFVHFTFTREQWDAMEPETLDSNIRNDADSSQPLERDILRLSSNPPEFGPAKDIQSSLLKYGDTNKDGKISKEEYSAIAKRWFSDWDKENRGKISMDQLRDGIDKTVDFTKHIKPEFGAPVKPNADSMLLGADGKRNGLAASLGIEFQYVHATMDFQGIVYSNVAVRYKGNGTFMHSRNSIKRSLKVDLDKFDKSQKLGTFTKLNFHNCVMDASWMNEVLSYGLYRDAGVPAPQTAYARVLITVPGLYDKKYIGLYSLVENIDSEFIKKQFGNKKGALLKPVTTQLLNYLGDDWGKYNQMYDPKTEMTVEEKSRIIDFARLLTKSNDDEFRRALPEYIDLEKFARYMAVTAWLSTLDSILGVGQNYYIHLKLDSKKCIFMPWDLDNSFGQFQMVGSQEQRENLSLKKPWQGENRFLERIYQHEVFQKYYWEFLRKSQKTIFNPERIASQVDTIAKYIRPFVKEESAEMLARFDGMVSGDSQRPPRVMPGFGPSTAGNRSDLRMERRDFRGSRMEFGQPPVPIKGFVKARSESVTKQLAGEREGSIVDRPVPRGLRLDFGGRPGGPPGFQGRPQDPSPSGVLARIFINDFDTDKDTLLSNSEFEEGLTAWFLEWDKDKDGILTEEQLRNGINRTLSPYDKGP